MKRSGFLKVWRVILAILFFSPAILFFVDFANRMPSRIHGFMHIQLIPAIWAGAVGVILILILLTLLFGRVYCSVICPAGVLQDLINRIYCIGKKKRKGVRRFRYRKPSNRLRYLLLLITAGTALAGVTELCTLLDPYSNFGRIANSLFRPVVIWGNNLLADGLAKIENYSLYHTSTLYTDVSLVAALLALTVFTVMVIFRGRLFCNTLCPTGAILSLVSRYSLFRFSFVKTSCTQCRLCEQSCKAEAINAKEMTVDGSRCVNCYNCLRVCKKDALRYRPFFVKDRADVVVEPSEEGIRESRRLFIATGATVAASIPVAALNAIQKPRIGNNGEGTYYPRPVTPPGSRNLERFIDKCTACHLCVARCPSHVLRPTGIEYGLDYLLKPRMAYIDSYCNFECTVCAEICPTKAIQSITKDEKAVIQVGIARFYIDRCIVYTEETDCGACSEHCPTQAVHMLPYKGSLTIPNVDQTLCIGCGGCESICPVRPYRAIIIEANEVHRMAEKPKVEESIEVDVQDFGF
jgi:ferredoxin